MRTAIFLLLIAVTSTAIADKANIDQCRYWQQSSDNYQDARRSGGTTKQMNHWKRKINKYRDLMRNGKCRRFSTKKLRS